MVKKTVIFFTAIFIVSSSCYLDASGFRIFELSARAATLGGAFAARVDDASAVFYNPAGLAFLSGLRIKTNICYLQMTSTAEYPESPESFKSNPYQIRASYFLSLNIKDRIGFGIGRFTPNSIDIKWPEYWVGNTLSIQSKLDTFYIRPVVAVKISDHLAVGAGLDFIFSDVTWIYDRIFTFQERGAGYYLAVNSRSDVSGKGIGFVTSILIRISNNLRIGVRYQPNVKLDLEGSHNFHIRNGYDPPFFDQEVTSTLNMPQEFVLGFMYSPLKNLNLQMDIQWVGMSKVKQWEFHLNPHFYEAFEDYYGFKPDYTRQGIDLNLKNTSRIMFGIEYQLRNLMAFRAGYTYQKGSVDGQRMVHPVFLDLNTNILSLGIGYEGPMFSTYSYDERIGGLSIDGFFQYGFYPNHTSALPELPVTYRANRWIVGFSVGFNF